MMKLKSNIKIKSIKTKLNLSIAVLVFIICSALGWITTQVASTIIVEEAEQSLLSLSQEAANLKASELSTQYRTLETLAILEDIKSMNWSLQQPILKSVLNSTDLLDLGIMQLDGTVTYSDGNTIQLDESDPARKATFEGINAINFGINPSTKELILMQSTPIKRDDQILGAIIIHRDGSSLSAMLSNINTEGEYAYILDNKGTMIGHPDHEKVVNQFSVIEEAKTNVEYQPLAKMVEQILVNNEGIGSYATDDGNVYLGYAPIGGTDWTLVTTVAEDEVLAALPKVKYLIEITSMIILAISLVIINLMGNSITKPIINTVKHALKIADLDISEKIDQKLLSKKDETGKLAQALQDIANGLRSIITQINYSAEQMAAASEELTATSEQTSIAAQEVGKTVQDIAEGASAQAEHTEDGSNKAILLGNTIEQVEKYIKNVYLSSNKVTEVVTEGLTEIESLNKITNESTKAVEEIYHVIMQTNESTSKIGEASNVIDSIAQQTNLLSLNAAIEAARAGDAGVGFAVVAEEIRKLAEQSSNSTKVIHDIVYELQNNMNNAVQAMERVHVISEEQSKGVIRSKNEYELIAESMNESITAIKELNSSGEEMDEMRQDILEVLQNLSAIAEENAAATEEASASTQEQAASVEEIANASENLSELATKLNSLVTRFKL